MSTKNSNRKIFLFFLSSIAIIYFILWIITAIDSYTLNPPPTVINVSVFIVLYVWYLFIYRRHNLLCFELIFIPVFFIALFFEDIVIARSNFFISGAGTGVVNIPSLIIKSFYINMIGFLMFMVGLTIANNKEKYFLNKYFNNYRVFGRDLNYKVMARLMTVFVGIYIIYLALDGSFYSWFHYSNDYYGNESNLRVGTLSQLLGFCTIFEFINLSKQGVSSFRQFLLKVNKIYLFELVLISFLLIASGNRNESLLFVIPAIVAYTIFVKVIPTRFLLLGIVVGVLIMTVIGWKRSGEIIEIQGMDLYTFTRDFGAINMDCTYLIHYADLHGAHLFSDVIYTIISGVPFFGGLLIKLFGLEYSDSATVATEGLQLPGVDSGLGTSLIGDLYYDGKSILVIIVMFSLGYLLSSLYNKFYMRKNFNIWGLVVYYVMMSNSVYYVRDMWYNPLSSIVYEYVLLFVFFMLFSSRNSKNIVNMRETIT